MSTRGERLKSAMRLRGINKQQALAFQIGVHESAITRWKDSGTLTLSNAVTLCAALDVSMDWLLLGQGTLLSHKAKQTTITAEHILLINLFEQLTSKTRGCLIDLLKALSGDDDNTNPQLSL